MLHASVGSIGWIAGGPSEVLGGVLDAIGAEGTLMMYVGWEGSPYDLLVNAPQVPPALLQLWPPYDPATSRAMHAWSILTEYLRTWPGAQRSQHPDSSFAAVGRLADELTHDHPLQYGMGAGSPLAKLCQHNGKVLLLGAPLSSLTLLHHAEHLADVPDKQIVRYKAPILRNGQKEWIDIEEFSTTGCLPWRGSVDLFEAIARQHIQEGHGIVSHVGAATSYLFDAAQLTQFAVDWIEEEFQEPPEALGEVQVRVADDRDHREIADLYAAMEEERSGTPVSTSRLSTRIDELLEDRDRQVIVAETPDRLVGMIVAHSKPGQRGVLEYAFVDPGYRRHGILRELEIEASTTLLERGCSSIGFKLDPDNHAAREAGTALGYAPTQESWERPL
jgi:aminoglycoside 3-N-acetyltransferase